MTNTRTALMVVIAGLAAASPALAAATGSTKTESPPAGWFGKTFGDLSWESAAAAANTPAGISWQVRRHVTYRTATVMETWQDGRQTWERGYGDCKAFAYCVSDLCDARGIPCWVSVVRPKGERDGHAVAMGVWQGKLWMSSNGLYSEHKTLEEALHTLNRMSSFRGKTLEFVPFSLM